MTVILLGLGLFIFYAVVGALFGSAIAVPLARWTVKREVKRRNAALKSDYEADCRRAELCGIQPPRPPAYWSLK